VVEVAGRAGSGAVVGRRTGNHVLVVHLDRVAVARMNPDVGGVLPGPQAVDGTDDVEVDDGVGGGDARTGVDVHGLHAGAHAAGRVQGGVGGDVVHETEVTVGASGRGVEERSDHQEHHEGNETAHRPTSLGCGARAPYIGPLIGPNIAL